MDSQRWKYVPIDVISTLLLASISYVNVEAMSSSKESQVHQSD